MRLTLKNRIFAVLFLTAVLYGCGDQDQQAQTNPENKGTTTVDVSAVEIVAYSHIKSCDQYLSVMQACIKTSSSSDEAKKLTEALNALGGKFSSFEDESVIQEQCEKALSDIKLHQENIGC